MGHVLAGEAAGDDVNASVCTSVELADVAIAWDLRPVVGKHGLAVAVSLDLRDGFATCELEAEVEAADAAE